MHEPNNEIFDVVVVGGGPAGATAAHRLAVGGWRVALLDRAGRIKPCGGAVPPRLIRDFGIPDHLIVARAKSAAIISPSGRAVDMPIEGGYVGMVNREDFDEWLRDRAQRAGAVRLTGRFTGFDRDAEGTSVLTYKTTDGRMTQVRGRRIIGADGARSSVARLAMPEVGQPESVFAYHEIVRAPEAGAGKADQGGYLGYHPDRCDIHYDGRFSPDFYSWIFPHGTTASIGTGSAVKGFGLRDSIDRLRLHDGLEKLETIREEGAPIPLKPLKKWDNGKDILLVGDAAGVVAPASGEGIYYAMVCGDQGAEGVAESLAKNSVKPLQAVRKRFLSDHGRVFWILGIMQKFWYKNDKRRERFTAMCADPDVQRLTWEAYMNKRLVKANPAAHFRIFMKDMAHLLGMVSPYHDESRRSQ